MKISDYAPRSGALDAHLTGVRLHGIEVGCDVGAHAEALLRYCSIDKLILVDLWENEFCRGFCMGRLQSQGWKNYVEFLRSDSHGAAQHFASEQFDFIYIDIAHDTDTVAQSLADWWPKLKRGGVLGYRNYTVATIRPAIDAFVAAGGIRTHYENYHNEMLLFREDA